LPPGLTRIPEKSDTDVNEMKEEMKAKLDSNQEEVTAI
jgi:translation elongation factor EF-1beta